MQRLRFDKSGPRVIAGQVFDRRQLVVADLNEKVDDGVRENNRLDDACVVLPDLQSETPSLSSHAVLSRAKSSLGVCQTPVDLNAIDAHKRAGRNCPAAPGRNEASRARKPGRNVL